MRLIHIDDGDALNIDCVVVNQADSKDCKCFYSCDLIDQYEARLKADMAAMLEDLRLEFKHSLKIQTYCRMCDSIDRKDVNKIIQQKINELKADQEGT